MTNEQRQAALDALGEILAWADVGQQHAPKGKTIIDVNWSGQIIRQIINTAPVLEPIDGLREAVKCNVDSIKDFINKYKKFPSDVVDEAARKYLELSEGEGV